MRDTDKTCNYISLGLDIDSFFGFFLVKTFQRIPNYVNALLDKKRPLNEKRLTIMITFFYHIAAKCGGFGIKLITNSPIN